MSNSILEVATEQRNVAHHLKRTLGYRCAAGYLRNQGYSLNVALVVLGFKPRFAS